MAEIHSTADVNAVSRTDKFGHSMPILKPITFMNRTSAYKVEHENKHVGHVWQANEGWYGSSDMNLTGPHESKHRAVAGLFNPIDPATAMDRKR